MATRSFSLKAWHYCYSWWHGVNSPPSEQNGPHFADIFRCIFVNEMFYSLVKISLKFVSKGPIDNNTALVQIMAWGRIGNKPLSEPMMTQFTDIYAALGGDELNDNKMMSTCIFIYHTLSYTHTYIMLDGYNCHRNHNSLYSRRYSLYSYDHSYE